MKQLTCEMCGGTDLVKQDGMFVCQTCGIKYSVEEAKKMMIEGTVDVQGTVMIDNSSFVQKYLENARRAKEKEDWEETEKYYNMVEQNAPDNIEAIFYSAYGKAKSSLVEDDIYKRQAAFKVLKNCISIIDDKFNIERRDENKMIINAMADDLAKMFDSNFVYTIQKNKHGIITKDTRILTYSLFFNLLEAFKETIDNIKKIDDRPYLQEASIRLYKVVQKKMSIEKWKNWNNIVQGWIDEEQRELEENREKMISTYWTEHDEEKTALETEKAELTAQIVDLNKQIENMPEYIAVRDIEKKIALKTKEKNELGLFKMKDKKDMQKLIDRLNGRLSHAKQKLDLVAAPIKESITKLNNRISEIDSELNCVNKDW